VDVTVIMVPYTEQDAMLHVIAWQIPAALMFAITGVWFEFFRGRIPSGCIRFQVIFVIGFLMLYWITTAAILVCLDMLLLPPLFALIRLSHSLSWGFA
jgi:hypothetical protein